MKYIYKQIELDSLFTSDVLTVNNKKYVTIKVDDDFKIYVNELYTSFFNTSFINDFIWVKLPFRYGKFENIEFVNIDGSFATSSHIKKDTNIKITLSICGSTDTYICWKANKIMFKNNNSISE